jgi:hypothetical protein
MLIPSLGTEGLVGRMIPVPNTTPPPPPPPPPPPVGTQPSGFDLPTADLAKFTLVYIEDFNRPVAEGPVTTSGAAAPFDNLYGSQAHNDFAGVVQIKVGTYPSTFTDTSKRGRYGAAILSVAANSSIVRERIRYEAGWPRVSAMLPQLGNAIGAPHGARDVLGGAFELVWRSDVIPTYKFVPLLWPQSNHRQTSDGVGADGEIDWPECNQWNGSKISGFMHWQGDVSTDTKTEQTSYTSPTVVLADGNWHKTRTEWIPGVQSGAHPTRSIGGSVKWYLDDVLVKTITGSTDGVTGPFVPMHPMHWVIQQETHLGSTAIDQSATGFLDIDWMAFYSYNG